VDAGENSATTEKPKVRCPVRLKAFTDVCTAHGLVIHLHTNSRFAGVHRVRLATPEEAWRTSCHDTFSAVIVDGTARDHEVELRALRAEVESWSAGVEWARRNV
jgi:hypothetical protein